MIFIRKYNVISIFCQSFNWVAIKILWNDRIPISVDYITHLFLWQKVKYYPYINEQYEHIFKNLSKYTLQILHNNACYVQMKLLEIEYDRTRSVCS